jgi:acyl carrier protein
MGSEDQGLSQAAVVERLQTFLGDLLQLENPQCLTPETRLEDLGLQSIHFVDLIVAIEAEFSFAISPATDFRAVATLGDLARLVVAQSAASTKGPDDQAQPR